jgi:hypothetical protein
VRFSAGAGGNRDVLDANSVGRNGTKPGNTPHRGRVGGGGDDSGSELGGVGARQQVVVVESAEMLDDPGWWVGEGVMGEGGDPDGPGFVDRTFAVPVEGLLGCPRSLTSAPWDVRSQRARRLDQRRCGGMRSTTNCSNV